MDIEVKLYAPLRHKNLSRVLVSLDRPATIETLLNYLAIEQYQVESVYINGRDSTFSQSLVSGDRVTLLPLIGGG
jgi:molybdopterin converting factor small subunit